MRSLLISSVFLFLCSVTAAAQTDSMSFTDAGHLSLETGIGVDLVYRAHAGILMKYNVRNHLTIATQTNIGRSYRSMGAIVSIPPEDFRSINFTFTQRFGAGAVLGSNRFSHTFLVMAGPNYYWLTETHNYPHFEETSSEVSTWVLDAGLLYGLKVGSGTTYFTSQLYVPVLLIPDNLMGVTLSVGIGFQLN